MHIRKATALFLTSVLLAGSISGCGDSASFFELNTTYSDVAGIASWGEAAKMAYEIPTSSPHIMVNQTGYQKGCRKIAVFEGKHLEETFRLVDAESCEVVYEGNIVQKGFDNSLRTVVGQGVFTDFDTEGTYYIESDGIGRSYPFTISTDLYGTVFESACQELLAGHTQWRNTERCYVLAALLTSYELYPLMYAGDGDGNEIPDILDFARIQLVQLTEDTTALSPELAMVQAQFSRIYTVYDKSYAQQCLRNAETFWKEQQKQNNGFMQKRMYLAESQLFRSTGKQKYHVPIKEYLKEHMADTADGMRIFADVAYLSTEGKVDMELCTELMDVHMSRAEAVSNSSHEQGYMISGTEYQERQEQIFLNMIQLAFVDYVITNHEYANVMENHLHYLMGRNARAVSYLPGYGYAPCEAGEDIMSSPKQHAGFIFMMSAVMNHNVDTGQ